MDIPIDGAGAAEIAGRRASRHAAGSKLLIKRIRDYAEIKGRRAYHQAGGAGRAGSGRQSMPPDWMRRYRRILLTVMEKFNGGPVGVDSLAAAVQEDRGTLEDVYEPYLIQAGFLEMHRPWPAGDQAGLRPFQKAERPSVALR